MFIVLEKYSRHFPLAITAYYGFLKKHLFFWFLLNMEMGCFFLNNWPEILNHWHIFLVQTTESHLEVMCITLRPVYPGVQRHRGVEVEALNSESRKMGFSAEEHRSDLEPKMR